MPNIPTVPGSDIEFNTPGKAVRLDAGALNSRYRGQVAMAGAIQNIGDEAEGLAQDLAKARNATIAADVDLRMRAAQQSFIETTTGDEHEDQWQERATTMADQVREDVYSAHEKIPPSMKGQVDSSLKAWKQGLQIKAWTMANIQTVNRTTSTLKQDFDEAGRDADAGHMAAVVQLGRASKLDPVLMDAWERAIPKTVAMTAIENGFNVNPKGTTDLLESGGSLPVQDQNGKAIVPKKVFSAKELEQLIRQGKAVTDRLQRDNYRDMLRKDANPDTDVVPEATIREKMKSGAIPEVAGRNLIASQNRKLKADTAEKARVLAKDDTDQEKMALGSIHDETAWGVSPEGYLKSIIDDASSISDPVKRQQVINTANHEYEAVKKKTETAGRTTERKIYSQMNEARRSNGITVPVTAEVTEGKKGWGIPLFPGTPLTIGSDGSPESVGFKHFPGSLAQWKAELLKESPKDIKAEYGEKATRESVLHDEAVHFGGMVKQMQDWFKTQKGDDPDLEEKAQAQRQKIEHPYVSAAVSQMLTKHIPTAVSTEEELDALPSGANAIWMGEGKNHGRIFTVK